MSAFIVEDKTINEIVSILHNRDFRAYYLDGILTAAGVDDADPAELGARMFELNIESVNERYGDGEAAGFRKLDYKFHWEPMTTNIQALKSLRCFLYQSCEGGCDQRELYKALDKFADSLAYHIVSQLPQYDKAAWR